jgi:hypothetical protein
MRTRGDRRSGTGRLRAVLLLTLLAGLSVALAPAAHAQSQAYSFTKVADSAADGFDPFGFGCASINDPGDIAFRAERPAPDGFNTIQGIYRADAGGGIATIAEEGKQFAFIGRNPSMNDLGQVSFAARLQGGGEAILRGDGKKLTTIASTKKEFNFFGFDTSVNNSGVVAFKAELDEALNFDEGLFSGSGGKVTTHYLASTSDFDGNDSRPSINNPGDIAFEESINFDDGIFVTEGSGFKTIAAPDPDRSVSEPVLNDGGTAAFERSFFDEATQEFVTEIVTGDGGPLTTVVDTRGPFSQFGFRPASLNNGGDVAFHATLDDGTTSGIFVGPDPTADRVIAVGDTLDGATVQNLRICEEGLNNSGELAFVADLEDPNAPEGFRVAVFRATPSP